MTVRRIMPTSSFIKRYLKANNISQRDLAIASGYTEKQVSLIMNDEVEVSPRFARAISSCIPGLDADFIIQYAKRYKEQLENDRAFLEQNDYKKYSKDLCFGKVFKHISSDPVEQTNIILDSYGMSTLHEVWHYIETDHTLKVVYSKDQSKLSDKDNVVVKLWTKAIMNQINALEDDRVFVGRDKTKQILAQNKDLLAVSNSEDLILNIDYICEKCGIHVAFSHTAPTTYVRGLSFSMNGQIFIVLTDRFKRVENIVFAFVHEMTHIIRGDIDDKHESIRFIDLDESDEFDVDEEAAEYLIPKRIYTKYISCNRTPTISNLISVAKESNTTIGLVVSRYHHESKDYTKYWQYLNEFRIENDIFGN